MRSRLVLALTLLTVLPAVAHAQYVVPWSTRALVDTDGDGLPDLIDNAPGLSNPSQIDTDNDLIGDAIDPTPVNSNPALGDPGLLLGAPSTIPPGSHALVAYLTVLGTPPGGYGHIDLDLGGDGTFDATYFGPLTSSTNTIDIPPSLFVDALWDLNTPGTYTLHALAFGPGMSSQNVSITTVTVTPEPAALSLFATVAAPLLFRRRRA